MVQRLRLRLPMQAVWVQSLVRELRSHTPYGQKKKKKNVKQKQKENRAAEDEMVR